MNSFFACFCWLILSCFTGCLYATTYSYKLLTGVDNNTVVVQETTTDQISGMDSHGGHVTLTQTKTRERHLELKKAFDIAIRYQNLDILAEALRKLEYKKETIDISDALAVVVQSLEQARSARRGSYWGAAAVGALGTAVLFLFPENTQNTVSTSIPVANVIQVGLSADVGRRVMGGLMVATAGFFAFSGWLQFNHVSRVYIDIIKTMLHSRVCVVLHMQRFVTCLNNIKKLLNKNDCERLVMLLQPMRLSYATGA